MKSSFLSSESNTDLNEKDIENLRAYGIDNAFHLSSLIRDPEMKAHLKNLLQIEEKRFNKVESSLISYTSMNRSHYDINFDSKTFPLGLCIDMGTQAIYLDHSPLTLIKKGKFVLPREVNLMEGLQPIRNQGRRGTCVAFAGTALREYFLGHGSEDLSEQFLYWGCKQLDGIPDKEGSYIEASMRALETYGICQEQSWPYNPEPKRGNEGQGPPPDDALIEAKRYQIVSHIELEPRNVEILCETIAKNQPLSIGIAVFKSFFNPYTEITGKVSLPLPGESIMGGHAILLMGYSLDEEIFYFRNSWGKQWANQSKIGAGYGTIPFKYIEIYNHSACTIDNKKEIQELNKMETEHIIEVNNNFETILRKINSELSNIGCVYVSSSNDKINYSIVNNDGEADIHIYLEKKVISIRIIGDHLNMKKISDEIINIIKGGRE